MVRATILWLGCLSWLSSLQGWAKGGGGHGSSHGSFSGHGTSRGAHESGSYHWNVSRPATGWGSFHQAAPYHGYGRPSPQPFRHSLISSLETAARLGLSADPPAKGSVPASVGDVAKAAEVVSLGPVQSVAPVLATSHPVADTLPVTEVVPLLKPEPDPALPAPKLVSSSTEWYLYLYGGILLLVSVGLSLRAYRATNA
jgi:hypothetical protein